MDSLFLQVSTNIYAPDRWRRAALGDKDSSEAKKLLRQRADSPIPVEIAVSLPVSIAQHRPWDERVRWVDEREYPEILVWLGDDYSVGNAYDEAHAAPGDALRSPHGMFF